MGTCKRHGKWVVRELERALALLLLLLLLFVVVVVIVVVVAFVVGSKYTSF